MDTLITDLIKRLERKAAFMPGIILPTSTIRDYITDNVEHYISNRLPSRQLGSFTTVSGTQEYTIDSTDVLSVPDIFFAKAFEGDDLVDYESVFNDVIFDGFHDEPNQDIAINYINNVYANYRRKESDAIGFYDNGTIRLSKDPAGAYNVYYIANKRWSYATLPNEFEKLLETATLIDMFETMESHVINSFFKGKNNYNTLLTQLRKKIEKLIEYRNMEFNLIARLRFGLM